MAMLCRALGVSVSGYYCWHQQQSVTTPRQLENQQLSQAIDRVHRTSHGTYGSPRIHAQLRAEGWKCCKQRVERLMHLAGAARQMQATPTSADDSQSTQLTCRRKSAQPSSFQQHDRTRSGQATSPTFRLHKVGSIPCGVTDQVSMSCRRHLSVFPPGSLGAILSSPPLLPPKLSLRASFIERDNGPSF